MKTDNDKFNVPTPKEIVKSLNKYIIGQEAAKKAVAIALRNRGRRRLLPEDLRDEVAPKNIIMIGPTGVGKTEIARRLSNLANAPFIKVEATKYTEVGYVGRDVESMIRDLTNMAVNITKSEMQKEVEKDAEKMVEERLLDLLFPIPEHLKEHHNTKEKKFTLVDDGEKEESNAEIEKDIYKERERMFKTREKFREKLKKGDFENKYVEIDTRETIFPAVEIFGGMNMDDLDSMLPGFSNMMPRKHKKRKVKIEEARKILLVQEAEKLIDMDKVISKAINKVENMGIVFIDEMDKVIAKGTKSGADVSREGVQRDLLPLVEGTSVMTKYGVVKTDHILFIAAGAFHTVKPSDLIPELQGRFPIRVELNNLTEKDFVEILTKPQNALIKQYKALLKTEGINLDFDKSAIKEIAKIAFTVNSETDNIGARRLHTILEKLLEDISFNAPDLEEKDIKITADYVKKVLKDIAADTDLSRYIL